MRNSNNSIKHPVAYRGFSSNSLLTLNSFIEEKVVGSSKYVKDLIFITFREMMISNQKKAYNKETELKIKVNSIKLRAIAIAIPNIVKSESIRRQNPNFDYSQALYSTKTASAELNIKHDALKNTYYINCVSFTQNKVIGVSFLDKYELLSFAESIVNIANVTENYLYKFQRELKTINDKDFQ